VSLPTTRRGRSRILKPRMGEYDLRNANLTVGGIGSNADIIYVGSGTVVQDSTGIWVDGYSDSDQMLFNFLRWSSGCHVRLEGVVDVVATSGYSYFGVGSESLMTESTTTDIGNYHTVGVVRTAALADSFLRGSMGALNIGALTTPADRCRYEYRDTAKPSSYVEVHDGVTLADLWGSGALVGTARRLGGYSGSGLRPSIRGSLYEAPSFAGPDPIVAIKLGEVTT